MSRSTRQKNRDQSNKLYGNLIEHVLTLHKFIKRKIQNFQSRTERDMIQQQTLHWEHLHANNLLFARDIIKVDSFTNTTRKYENCHYKFCGWWLNFVAISLIATNSHKYNSLTMSSWISDHRCYLRLSFYDLSTNYICG